jgi:hypothetical protein
MPCYGEHGIFPWLELVEVFRFRASHPIRRSCPQRSRAFFRVSCSFFLPDCATVRYTVGVTTLYIQNTVVRSTQCGNDDPILATGRCICTPSFRLISVSAVHFTHTSSRPGDIYWNSRYPTIYSTRTRDLCRTSGTSVAMTTPQSLPPCHCTASFRWLISLSASCPLIRTPYQASGRCFLGLTVYVYAIS